MARALVSDVSVIDPQLLTTMPEALNAATGLDALTHGVEAFVSLAHGPLTDDHALQALWSAAQYRTDVTFVVMNNRQYKILRLLGEMGGAGEGVPGLDLPELDIVGAARSLGCEGASVNSPEELPDALESALNARRPYVLNVLVDPNIPKSLE